jgi:hypothetical protein
MRALTLWQPWAWAISDFTKRIENRPWSPPEWLKGRFFAIHAGKTYDETSARHIEEAFGVVVPRDLPLGAIVAIARLVSVVTESDDSWFAGPCGWILDDVVKLDSPVMCRGAQGLWTVPWDVERQVILQLPRDFAEGTSGGAHA